jgi:hypothetical protein
MIDYLAFFFTLNLLVVTFYGCYSVPASMLYKDKLKSLYATLVIFLLGIPIVLIHLFKQGKTK